MKAIVIAALAAVSLAGLAAPLRAQDQTMAGPPKVLVVVRETVKLGKDAGHEKNEGAYAQAMAAAKSPAHFLAATSISGPDMAWFLNGYASFADAEKSHEFYESHAALKAQIDKLQQQDADYISDATTMIAVYNDKWSYRPNESLVDKPFIEVETIELRPGHGKEWEDLINLFLETAPKANMTQSDVFYEVRYGARTDTVLIFVPRKSVSDLDEIMGTDKAFEEALGESGRKRWSDLVQACVANDWTDLLVFNPAMSYPPDDFIKGDPDFWKPKHMAAAAAKTPPAKPGADAAAAK
jgi:hypothetical protein